MLPIKISQKYVSSKTHSYTMLTLFLVLIRISLHSCLKIIIKNIYVLMRSVEKHIFRYVASWPNCFQWVKCGKKHRLRLFKIFEAKFYIRQDSLRQGYDSITFIRTIVQDYLRYDETFFMIWDFLRIPWDFQDVFWLSQNTFFAASCYQLKTHRLISDFRKLIFRTF